VASTKEPTLLPVAPHSVDSEFLLLDRYRGIVEEAVFDRLGRPSFLDEAVEMLMGRIAARIENKKPQATAKACATGAPQEFADQGNSNGKSMRFAPQLSWIQELAKSEAQKLRLEIKRRFERTGRLGLPLEDSG
jgi:hypothetical protein